MYYFIKKIPYIIIWMLNWVFPAHKLIFAQKILFRAFSVCSCKDYWLYCSAVSLQPAWETKSWRYNHISLLPFKCMTTFQQHFLLWLKEIFCRCKMYIKPHISTSVPFLVVDWSVQQVLKLTRAHQSPVHRRHVVHLVLSYKQGPWIDLSLDL